jgi:hypothetical protein
MSHPAIPVRIQIFEKSPKMNGKVKSCRCKARASFKAVRRNLEE